MVMTQINSELFSRSNQSNYSCFQCTRTINSVEEIIKSSHKKGAVVLVDGAQSPHRPVDMQSLGADFYILGTQNVGPTGFGILYGKRYLIRCHPIVWWRHD